MERPDDLFDRADEWSALTRFVTDDRPGATLGVVSGRRRQGKTFLLDAACQAAGGFYFGATEATAAESLRRLGAQLTAVRAKLGNDTFRSRAPADVVARETEKEQQWSAKHDAIAAKLAALGCA